MVAVLEVSRRHRAAVAPFEAVAQGKGVGQAVVRDFDRFSLAKLHFGPVLNPVKAFENLTDHVRTWHVIVEGAVQSSQLPLGRDAELLLYRGVNASWLSKACHRASHKASQ